MVGAEVSVTMDKPVYKGVDPVYVLSAVTDEEGRFSFLETTHAASMTYILVVTKDGHLGEGHHGKGLRSPPLVITLRTTTHRTFQDANGSPAPETTWLQAMTTVTATEPR